MLLKLTQMHEKYLYLTEILPLGALVEKFNLHSCLVNELILLLLPVKLLFSRAICLLEKVKKKLSQSYWWLFGSDL